MKSFIIHKDSLLILEELTDEQAGKLFKAISNYQNGIETDLDFGLRMAFAPFKNQFIRDLEKYNEKCERNKSNGNKGGRPKKDVENTETQTNPKNPVGYFETEKTQTNPKNPNEPYNNSNNNSNNNSDSDSKNENNNKNDLFYNQLILSESWLDNVAMNYPKSPKFTIPEVKDKLLFFKNDCNNKLSIKNNKKEFAQHFVSWFNLQEKPKPEILKNQNHGSTFKRNLLNNQI